VSRNEDDRTDKLRGLLNKPIISIEQVAFGDEALMTEALLPRAGSQGWFQMLVEFYYKSFGIPAISMENDTLKGQLIIGMAYPPRGWRWEGTATKPKPTIFFSITKEQLTKGTREDNERMVKWGFRKILDRQ
jgi:hypothetical protein